MTKATDTLKLHTLEIENFMRVVSATIQMGDDGAVIIEGKNGQGKSSTVKALAALIGGAKCYPDDPIHGDAQSSKIIGRFGDGDDELVVTLKFT